MSGEVSTASLASSRQFLQVLLRIYLTCGPCPKEWQRRSMPEAAALHLDHQLCVTRTDTVQLDQPAFEESSESFFATQRAHEHVQFDVLTQQVLIAHLARIHHPHAHGLELRQLFHG